MDFNISVQSGRSYLLIVASGSGGESEFFASNQFVAELVRESSPACVMLDMLALVPRLDAESAQRVAAHLASVMPRFERLAILVPPGKSLGIVVQAAERAGVRAREFSDIVKAEAWLAGGA